jgi:poly(A) polymerase
VTPVSIAGAPFLDDEAFQRVIAALEQDGDRARVVGGAVRNTLLGEPVDDVDIATTARPEVTMVRAAAAGLKPVPTGIDHGTVTVVANGRPFEVTTLRADVETDGRHAVVAFTDDWRQDACRRDFTMNAIYADADGTLFDPVGGVADARARHVRFIGDPAERIAEDYLRILRFFRFHARYGEGSPDSAGLAASVAMKDGLDRLSRERVGTEVTKLVMARGAVAVLQTMQGAGILSHVLKGEGDVARLGAVIAGAARHGAEAALELRLAALAVDHGGLVESLRLSNRQKKRIESIDLWCETFARRMDAITVKEAVYRAGNEVAFDALLLAAATSRSDAPSDIVELARHFAAPAFPVTASLLIAEGYLPGPALGAELRRREAAWIAAGCPASDQKGL